MNLGFGYYFLFSLVLTLVVSAAMAVHVRIKRNIPGAVDYFLLSLGLLFLALTEILCLFGGSAGQALFWFKTRSVFIAVIPVFFLGFAVRHTGRWRWLSRRIMAGFFIVPVIGQVLFWTNGAHHLFLKKDVGFVLEGPFWIAVTSDRRPGVGFLAFSIYGIILLLGALGLLVADILRKKPRNAGQVVFICAGGATATATTLGAVFDLFPHTEFNVFTPGLGLSFLLVAVAVFRFKLLRRSSDAVRPDGETASGGSLLLFFLILAIFASSIIAAGYLSFRDFEAKLRIQSENQLWAISELKVDELHDWRLERKADAEILQHDGFFADLAGRFLKSPDDTRVREELKARLRQYLIPRQYAGVYLLDMRGIARLSIPETNRFPPSPDAVRAVTTQGSPRFADFHRDEDHGPIHLSLYAPIFTALPRGRLGAPIGAVVFWVDPAQYLYPFIMKWPGESATAETYLVRREQEAVEILNDLKFRPGAALNLRFPLTRTTMPAVQAVLGRQGVVEGLDYRDQPVLAALRPIPDSSWFLVARMELAEVYAPVRRRLWGTIFLLAALLAASASILGLIWRSQRLRYFRSRAEIGQKLQETLERFELANKATFDVVWDWDLRADTIWRNEHLQGMVGYKPEDLEKGIQSWSSHVHPEDRDRVFFGIQAVIDGKSQFWSDHYRFAHKDGRYLEIYDRGYVMRDEDGRPVRMIGAMQDLTERFRAEREVLHSRDLMRYIIEHNRSAVAVHDRDLRYLYVSQRYLDEYRIKDRDIIGKHHYEVFPDLPRKWREVHQKALAGVVSRAEDEPYIRADGTVDWTRWECRPWYKADGSIGGIIIYTEVVTERMVAQDKLRKSLREKEVLLKEIHHRVKNNMQVISSLLNLQSAQIGDARFQEALRETQRRIRSMALLHEKLYMSRDLSRIDFVEYARSLADHIFRSFLMDIHRIDVRFEMDPVYFDIATANPLGLILNELLSNAVKHAFPDGRRGEIFVGLRRLRQEDYLLTVRDDGVGLPSDFDLAGTTSFGLQIIESLVSQLNGIMTIGKTPRGASFELRFHELHYVSRLDPEMRNGD